MLENYSDDELLKDIKETLKDKNPPKCNYCGETDLSLIEIEHYNNRTTIFCNVCGKATIISEIVNRK